MRTVSQVVESIIERSPLLAEIMGEGLANNAQIARRIKPEVEKILFEEVSEQAIAMALHRLSQNLQVPNFGLRFLKQLSDITVRSNLIAFACPNTIDLEDLLHTVSKSAKRRKDTFLNFSRGLRESLLIVDQTFAKEVADALKGKPGIKKISDLSAITMHLPEASLNVPGLYYPILKALAADSISFVEVMSVRTEFTILFENKDVDRAFSVLKKLTS